jgi:hypothetical protein
VISKHIKYLALVPVVMLALGCQSTTEFLDSATASLKSVMPGNDIHALAYKGDIKGIQAIIDEKGADVVNKRNDIGNTPIMMAAFKGQSKTIDYLLKKGANIKLVNKDGETVFTAAAQGKQPATFISLKAEFPKLAKKADYNRITPYMRAAYSGIGEEFFYNLDDKSFYAKDAEGSDILSWSVGGGNTDLVLYYGKRAGKNLNIDKVRKAQLDNFDNPQSKQSLAALTKVYCNYAWSNKSFKPKSSDSLKFGRHCKFDWNKFKKQRNG